VTPDSTVPQETTQVSYTGRKAPLLKLALWTGLLTLLTLGFYRFWARTRIRKYFWSAITPDGTPLEYNGTGLEKLLGFLIAVAVLAIYLGIFQLLLLFFGYSLFTQADTFQGVMLQNLLIYGAALATLPLIYYAQYRARRYVLSRTRWRGIRFGATPAAWGYVKLGLKNLFVTIITLGILLPRQTFNMEKYRVDRSYFGNAQFHQGGDWRMLRPAMKQLYIAMALIVASVIVFLIGGLPNFEGVENGDMDKIGPIVVGAVLLQLGVTWFYVGMAIYNVASWRILANEKTLGDEITFISKVDTSDVIMAYIFGGMLAFFVALIGAVIIGVGFGFLTTLVPASDLFGGVLANLDSDMSAEELLAFAGGGILGYISFFILMGAIATVAITQVVLRNFASTITIHNAEELNTITQRAGDDFVEAEGFADALDVGAAF
jgi:uncharacterized membrane protein YjgN (DUF898 family)